MPQCRFDDQRKAVAPVLPVYRRSYRHIIKVVGKTPKPGLKSNFYQRILRAGYEFLTNERRTPFAILRSGA